MNGATARGAVMGQNRNGIDQAGAVLFRYPPHSPALPDKKSPIHKRVGVVKQRQSS
jgi:hypothetical protein